MFIDSTNYKRHVEALIQQSDRVDIAVAFWGAGAAKLIEGLGKRFRILCNLRAGGTNPAEVRALLEYGHDVLALDDLHAKVVIGDRAAIVGSANFSTNGLNIEAGEFDSWQEAGYLSESPADLREMQEWFEGQWKRGYEITDKALIEAQANWDKRRVTKIPFSRSHESVLSMARAELEGRNIFVALWRDTPSAEAEAEAECRQERLDSDVTIGGVKEWDFFEDWDDMRVGQKVISAFVGPRGRIAVEGVFEIFEVFSKQREDALRRGEQMQLHICYKLDELLGIPFTRSDCENLATLVRRAGNANELIEAGTPLVPLGAFLEGH